LPEKFTVPETEAEATLPVHEAVKPKGSVLGKLVGPDVIRKLEPLARELLEL
jgi:hypothetical protein